MPWSGAGPDDPVPPGSQELACHSKDCRLQGESGLGCLGFGVPREFLMDEEQLQETSMHKDTTLADEQRS